MGKEENFGDKLCSNGFQKNPDNINRTGANKGSKWRKTLLKDLLTIGVDEDNADFNKLKNSYPKQFNMSEEKNLQLYLELKQISLAFSEAEVVAQKAITEIKDRIEGKSTQIVETKDTTIEPLKFEIITKDDKTA